MISFDARLEMQVPKVVNRFSPRYAQAQKMLDNEVIKDTEPYVPMRTGMLARSGQIGSVLGSGKVVYNAPYARRLYYGAHFNFSKDAHPLASAHWFEKSKAVNQKKWLDTVERIITG